MRRQNRSVAAIVIAILAGLALATPAQASALDTDHDGMPNRWERAHGLDWHKANAKADPDHDGIPNIREFHMGTDPRKADVAAVCTDLEIALGATDPSQCGSASLTEVLH